MGSLKLAGVEKWFGDTQVIKGVDIQINDGEFVVFVGPSGCGKSTLLRMIAGLEDTSRGTISLNDKDVTGLPPSGRKLSMVFQSYALYPHMSVGENMGFGLKTAGAPKAEIEEKVNRAAKILELESYLDRRPKALSGGQRQRVAIGRAIVRQPQGFLFDEPLSNLDAALRVQMRFEIAKLHSTLKTTTIYVTHDQVEAMTLADRIVVLKDGLVMQVGTPVELYERPANLFVAGFIGSPKMNIMPCVCNEQGVQLEGHPGVAKSFEGTVAAQVTTLGIRPEHIKPTDESDAHCIGVVEFAEYLGSDTFLYVKCDNLGMLTVRAEGAAVDLAGKRIGLKFDERRLHLFDGNEDAFLVG